MHERSLVYPPMKISASSSQCRGIQSGQSQGALAGGDAERTLVFAKNVAAADKAAEALRDAGLEVALYHRNVPAEERAAALAAMAGRCKTDPVLHLDSCFNLGEPATGSGALSMVEFFL